MPEAYFYTVTVNASSAVEDREGPVGRLLPLSPTMGLPIEVAVGAGEPKVYSGSRADKNLASNWMRGMREEDRHEG